MYDELAKRLRDAAKMSEALAVLLPHSEGNATAKLYNEAADAIEELMRRCEQFQYMPPLAWIPVTERLPEDAGVYLCRIKSFNGDFRYTDALKYVDGFFYEQGVAIERITHWMPLPEPPEGES